MLETATGTLTVASIVVAVAEAGHSIWHNMVCLARGGVGGWRTMWDAVSYAIPGRLVRTLPGSGLPPYKADKSVMVFPWLVPGQLPPAVMG